MPRVPELLRGFRAQIVPTGSWHRAGADVPLRGCPQGNSWVPQNQTAHPPSDACEGSRGMMQLLWLQQKELGPKGQHRVVMLRN